MAQGTHVYNSLEMAAPTHDGVADLLKQARYALRLARDPSFMASVRAKLAMARERSPLFDTARFTRELEALYRRMWQRHAAGLPPETLPAEVPAGDSPDDLMRAVIAAGP